MWMKVVASLTGASLLVLPAVGGHGVAAAAEGGGAASPTVAAPPAAISASQAGQDAVHSLGAGTVEGVTSAVSGGQAVYQVEVRDQGLTWTITVDMAGNVLDEVVDNPPGASSSTTTGASVTPATQPTGQVSGDQGENESEQPEVNSESESSDSQQVDAQDQAGNSDSSSQLSAGASVGTGGSSDQPDGGNSSSSDN